MSMLSARTTEIVDEYWARDLGCRRDELRPPVPRIQAHGGGLKNYPGVFILTLGVAPVVSAPSELATALSPGSALFTAESVAAPDELRGLLGPAHVERVIGPAFLNYADAGSFRSPDVGTTRELSVSDTVEFEALRAICASNDWEGKGFDLQARRTFGAFGDGGHLLAIAHFEIWEGRIAHLSVVAHPHARRRGHATRAVAAAARCALDSDLVLQYRVLRENVPSRRVAAKLGFEAYGWSIAARLAA
jgi:RimJ/RimL family protein N-acetyltransferase